MNSDTPKGGIATPESPPLITQTPQTERAPTLAPYPTYQYPYPLAPYRYPPVRPREPGGANIAAWIIGGIVAFVVLGWSGGSAAGGPGRRHRLLHAQPA